MADPIPPGCLLVCFAPVHGAPVGTWFEGANLGACPLCRVQRVVGNYCYPCLESEGVEMGQCEPILIKANSTECRAAQEGQKGIINVSPTSGNTDSRFLIQARYIPVIGSIPKWRPFRSFETCQSCDMNQSNLEATAMNPIFLLDVGLLEEAVVACVKHMNQEKQRV